nr:unnamed protein product [Callosobruchus analis]
MPSMICVLPNLPLEKTGGAAQPRNGIGYETAIDFAKRGAKVIIACRNQERAEIACEKIRKETHNTDIHYKLVDFASFASVRRLAEEINKTEDHLDILVNNAGAYNVGDHITEDGLQLLFQTNHYSPFLLTHLLLDLLKKSKSRIVNVSSYAANWVEMDLAKLNRYNDYFTDYKLSKLCNVMFTIELAARLRGTSVTTYSVHPGIVTTEINKDPGLRGIIVRALVQCDRRSSNFDILRCCHFEDCHMVNRYKSATDITMIKKLWEESEKAVKLK